MTAVIFDLDETLIDRSAAMNLFCQQLWQAYDLGRQSSLSDFTARVIELDRVGYTPRPEFFNQLWEALRPLLPTKHLIESVFYQTVWETPVLFDGAIDHLALLRSQGVAMALVTNGSVKAQSAKIEHSGIAEYFDAVVVSEAIGVKKPDPSIFQTALTILGAEPADCWFVGDHPVNDIWGSKQLGMKTAWVHHQRHWSDDVAPCFDVQGECLNDVMPFVIASVLARRAP